MFNRSSLADCELQDAYNDLYWSSDPEIHTDIENRQIWADSNLTEPIEWIWLYYSSSTSQWPHDEHRWQTKQTISETDQWVYPGEFFLHDHAYTLRWLNYSHQSETASQQIYRERMTEVQWLETIEANSSIPEVQKRSTWRNPLNWTACTYEKDSEIQSHW